MAEQSAAQDLVGIARRRFEAGNRRDAGAVLSFYAPNAVFDASEAGLGTYEGADAIKAFLEEWWSGYEEYQNVPDEIVQVGEEAVLVINTLFGRLPGSSESLRQHNAYLFQFREGLIVRWTAFMDIARARAAADRLARDRR
jgi:ketosteroid isomerase-like protein